MHPCVGCICATFCAISGPFRPPVFIFSCDVSTSPFLSPSTPCLFFHFEYGWLPWKPPPPPPLAHYQLLLLQYLRLVVVAWQLVTQCFLATGPPEGSANPEPLCISNPRIPPRLFQHHSHSIIPFLLYYSPSLCIPHALSFK